MRQGPVSGGIGKVYPLEPGTWGVVRDPERYQWTSHLSYRGKEKERLVDAGLVLGQFGANKSVARRRYREFILEGVDGGHQEKFYEVKDQRSLGEGDFINRIDEKRRVESVIYDIPIEVIAREVSKASGVAINRLYSLSRER